MFPLPSWLRQCLSLRSRSFGWVGADAFVQHDVNELFNVLTSALENTFKGTRGDGIIQALFEGRQKDYIRCLNCGYESKREEVFKTVNVFVKPFGEEAIGSLEEGLTRSFTAERLCGENQYSCDGCSAKVDADKGQKLSKVPYLLSFSLVRFQYDFMTDRCAPLIGNPNQRISLGDLHEAGIRISLGDLHEAGILIWSSGRRRTEKLDDRVSFPRCRTLRIFYLVLQFCSVRSILCDS